MLAQHLLLAFVPLLLGLVPALPLGVLLGRAAPWRRAQLIAACALIEAVPALAWFVFLPAVLGTRLDSRTNVVVGLTILVAVMMTSCVAAALNDVPAELRATADALGFTTSARLRSVELPVALPALIAGLRTAVVSCVSLATLAALVGAGGLGRALTEGFTTHSEAEVLSGTAVLVALAAAAEALLVRAGRMLAPWSQLAPVR